MDENMIRQLLIMSLNNTAYNIGNRMADILEDFLNNRESDPRYYSRTGGLVMALRNPPAISLNASGNVEINFYNRNMLVSKKRAKSRMYGTYMGFPRTWGSAIDDIYYYQNYGYYAPGSLKDRDHYTPGIHFIEKTFGLSGNKSTQEQIDERLGDMVADEFIELYNINI